METFLKILLVSLYVGASLFLVLWVLYKSRVLYNVFVYLYDRFMRSWSSRVSTSAVPERRPFPVDAEPLENINAWVISQANGDMSEDPEAPRAIVSWLATQDVWCKELVAIAKAATQQGNIDPSKLSLWMMVNMAVLGMYVERRLSRKDIELEPQINTEFAP